MQESVPPRSTFSVGVIAASIAAGAIALFGGMTVYSVSRALNEAAKDPFHVELALEQFAPVRDRVPATAVLGYTSDLELSSDAGKAGYFAAQYALAPRILVDAASRDRFDYVLGNWAREQDYVAAGQSRGLIPLADLGHGIFLYRKGAR
jgi:hypothetical protein